MTREIGITCATIILLFFLLSNVSADSGPFDGKNFKGRIAYSGDGNHNDEDDWAASPVALAIFAEFGVKDKLVHFDYNSILPETNPEWEKQHETSVLGAAERYGYRKSTFHNCRKNLDAAVDSIKNAINQSSADNPLYFIVAGPMEVPFLGIVYVISHSRWNDGFDLKYAFTHNKRGVIPLGIKWVQIRDQNKFLSTTPFGRPATEDEWRPWHWMRDSNDPKVRFLWDRMRETRRADCSDSGMAYFLMTGDQEPEIAKLRLLLDDNVVPKPISSRRRIRIEAENFLGFDKYEVEYRADPDVSHTINVKLADITTGRIRTPFAQPYCAASGRYDVDVRYLDEKSGRSKFALSVNGIQKGDSWHGSHDDQRWRTHRIADVNLNSGDEIMVEVEGNSGEAGRLDYVELNYKGPSSVSSKSSSPSSTLDDIHALTGQVIVAGANPGYLKYNGGGPVFLSGPDNPEDFLYRGTLNPDGTRSAGGQEEMINRMAQTGVNAFHCQMFRMRRCNIKDEGDDTHCPFVDHDPSKPLNEAVLNQWEGWLDLFEQKSIIVHLEFYNDATDVERMGWTLNARGSLHPDEKRWIEGVVKKFKHHKNLIWGIEESCNKVPGARTQHFKEIGEVIARADDHNHPIVQSFVVPNDPDGDFPAGGILADAYIGDPNIRVVTWLHVVQQGDDLERMHREYLDYRNRGASDFVVMKNESFHHPRSGPLSRNYMWSAAMAGIHTLEAYHHADTTPEDTLRDDSRIKTFMEQTDFYRMKPRDDLANGSTKWVLANPAESYIAYTYNYSGPMGIRAMKAGTYELKWFDAVNGKTVTQPRLSVSSPDAAWHKPDSFGNEIALYIKRLGAN
jgi:hypothetical protein